MQLHARMLECKGASYALPINTATAEELGCMVPDFLLIFSKCTGVGYSSTDQEKPCVHTSSTLLLTFGVEFCILELLLRSSYVVVALYGLCRIRFVQRVLICSICAPSTLTLKQAGPMFFTLQHGVTTMYK